MSAPVHCARASPGGENFNDPQLSALIDGMLIANQDLALAGLQWREAMLEAGLAQGNLTPDLAANLSGRNTRALRGATTPLESYRAGLSLSYELDLWGKLARIREQAEWRAVASALDPAQYRVDLDRCYRARVLADCRFESASHPSATDGDDRA